MNTQGVKSVQPLLGRAKSIIPGWISLEFLLHTFGICIHRQINIVKNCFQKIISELGIDFYIYSFWREDGFCFVLKLWADEAQLPLHPTAHASWNLALVCGRMDKWMNGWTFLLSCIPLVSIWESREKNERRHQVEASMHHTSHLWQKWLLLSREPEDRASLSLSVSYPSWRHYTLSSVLGSWWNAIEALPKCSLYL